MLKILKYAWNAIVIIIWYFLYLSNASGPLVRIQKCLAFGWNSLRNSQCKLQQWFKIKILKSYNIILHCLFKQGFKLPAMLHCADFNSLPCYIVQNITPSWESYWCIRPECSGVRHHRVFHRHCRSHRGGGPTPA